MAKVALTLTLLIALFFVAGAEHPIDGSVSFHDTSITLPEPDSKRTILLPSEKPESEPATVVELEQIENEKDTTVNETEQDMEEIVEEEEKPRMRIAYRDLRPVWPRDVDQRMMFVFRHHPHHHRCHHPHRRPHPYHQIMFRQFDVERPEPEQTERSYGNDMLVADPGFEQREGSLDNDMLVADPEMEKGFGEEALEQDLTEIRLSDVGGRRHAPYRWVGLHFGGRPRFPIDPDHGHEHGPHHRRHPHDHAEDEEHRHEHRPDDEERRGHHRDEYEHRHHHDEKRPFGVGRREENGGGLVKRFRKFLHKIDF